MGEFSLTAAKSLLLLLHHRGQDAAGLLWTDEQGQSIAKSLGSPERINVPEKASSMILGSTRYPTCGRELRAEEELDTMVGPFSRGGVALTHNGNVTNMEQCSAKRYECDAEFILDRLNTKLVETKGDIVQAFTLLEHEIDGAYSLVGTYKDRLFAYRDPRGFKPLVFGKSETTTIVASESTVLDMAGMSVERDVYPGELILFSADGSMQSYSVSQTCKHSHCFFEYVYFANPAARIENQLVYDVRFRLGRSLADIIRNMHLEHPDYVVPVPDTSRPAAQALAEELGVPMREIILKNRYLGRTFIAQTQRQRDRMARNKYIYLEDKIRGKCLLVVDDSIVRGTTAKMIIADLRRRGARMIYFAVTSPPQNHPCYYGIDISTSRELIASEASAQQIREFVGADALIYQDMNGLVNAIGLRDNCLACLNGEYPTQYARHIREVIAKEGESQGIRDYERTLK